MPDFEKLGAFYLGRPHDPATRTRAPEPLLYDSKDLVTHGVCVGMTGSGKTGLCIALLEEAAIDGIPALIIDPKGDLANLLLTFPALRGSDFRPWINTDDARKKGLDPDAFAQQQADLWRKGLADWGQSPERIQKLRESADVRVYTPGSSAGIPISILKSFDCPAQSIRDDRDLFRERVQTTVSSLLGLLGIEADPVRSREHILLSTLVTAAWSAGQATDLGRLVEQVQKPPMTRVGVMEVESFYPQADRFALAMQMNSLLASPGFASWSEGEALDIQNLLYTPEGKPRLAIVSIAHLSDGERMFFVATLLSEVLGWTRQQTGTTSLRAILYMDEIAGYCPPVANPPSKLPLLTLMKQARAFGVGVLLATQNPVDLDYKGLSNAGTWFIGRLQTDRDKQRVLDGLEGAASAVGTGFNRAEMDRLISALGQRVFLLNNVHESHPVVFETRWCLSYLRGPMTRDQIRQLTDAAGRSPFTRPAAPPPRPAAAAPASPQPAPTDAPEPTGSATPPVLPPGLTQYFLPIRSPRPAGAALRYEPAVLASGIVHFSDAKLGIDHDDPAIYLTPITAGPVSVDWLNAEQIDLEESDLATEPEGSGGGGGGGGSGGGGGAGGMPVSFTTLSPDTTKPKSWSAWQKDFADLLARTRTLPLKLCPTTGEVSRPGESERDFRARLVHAAREQRDAAVAKLRGKYASKLQTLQDRLRRAEQAVEVQEAQARDAKLSTAFSFGAAILGAIMGRKAASSANVGRAATAARGVNRSTREAGDVARAEENLAAVRQQLAELEAQVQAEVDALAAAHDPSSEPLQSVTVRAKKTQVKVRLVTLAWLPTWLTPSGTSTPAWH
jgi:hypothetical protein